MNSLDAVRGLSRDAMLVLKSHNSSGGAQTSPSRRVRFALLTGVLHTILLLETPFSSLDFLQRPVPPGDIDKSAPITLPQRRKDRRVVLGCQAGPSAGQRVAI